MLHRLPQNLLQNQTLSLSSVGVPVNRGLHRSNENGKDGKPQDAHAIVLRIYICNFVLCRTTFSGFLGKALQTTFHRSIAPQWDVAAGQVNGKAGSSLEVGRSAIRRGQSIPGPSPVHGGAGYQRHQKH